MGPVALRLLRLLPRVGAISTFAVVTDRGRLAPAPYRVCRVTAPYAGLEHGGVFVAPHDLGTGEDVEEEPEEATWLHLTLAAAVDAHRPASAAAVWGDAARLYSEPRGHVAEGNGVTHAAPGPLAADVTSCTSAAARTAFGDEETEWQRWLDVPEGAVVADARGNVAQSHCVRRRWLRVGGEWYPDARFRDLLYRDFGPWRLLARMPHDAPVERIREAVELESVYDVGGAAPSGGGGSAPPPATALVAAEPAASEPSADAHPEVRVGTRVRWLADGDEGEVVAVGRGEQDAVEILG